MSVGIGCTPDEIQCVDIGKGVMTIFYGNHPDAMKESQILRAAPKLFELVSRFVSAEHEEMQAVGKKVRTRHEAEDLLKKLGCAIAPEESEVGHE